MKSKTLALLAALLVGFVVFAPSAGAALPARTATETRFGNAVLATLNAERRAHGLPALRLNAKLMLSARQHDVTMAHHNTLSHQLPGEAYFGTRITRAGYRWSYAGENIGWNSQMTQAGVVALEVAMYNERPPNDGHRLNILNRNYRDVGVDVYLDPAHHKIWLTTDFGRPA